jgi:signal transduction histidine kinase
VIQEFQFSGSDFEKDEPKELMLLSIISQSFFQPFSIEDNLLVILTALTSGSGVGFNRAMLFRASGESLKGELWLGPQSAEEANSIWEVLSTPGIGYIEIIEHNRALLRREADSLNKRIKALAYPLDSEPLSIPALPAAKREVVWVKEAWTEPLVDKSFLNILNVDEFLCVPLFSGDEILGEVILDNAITRKPIEHKDVKLASLCGLMAGNYMYSTALNKKVVEMERMAALGEMAMFIMHQLRNPLAAIGGFTDQLLNSTTDEARTRRNLDIIRKEIKRLEDVLFKLSPFLKMDLRKPISFELPPLVQAVLQSTSIQLKREGIQIDVEIENGLPEILGDPTYIGEALRNLLDNALEATPQAGRVSVRAGRGEKNSVVLSIQDTGRGVPEAIKKKIFEPFLSTKEKSMGVGLFYVKRVMEACGGRIEVESEPGKGTLFRLFFRSREERKEKG